MQAIGFAASEISDFQQKVIIGVLSAILAFLSTLFFERLKARRESRRELTWEARTQAGIVSIDPSFQERVTLTYAGNPVDNISSIDFKVRNTGNEVIKSHLLRFAFPSDCRILEARLSPEPERELGVRRETESEQGPSEVIYKIGHLEAGQEVSLQIVTSGASAKDWRPHSHNDDGNVRFEERSAARAKDDSEHVTPFLVYAFTLLAVAPAARVAASALTAQRTNGDLNIEVNGGESTVQVAQDGGANRMNVPGQCHGASRTLHM